MSLTPWSGSSLQFSKDLRSQEGPWAQMCIYNIYLYDAHIYSTSRDRKSTNISLVGLLT